MIAPRFVGYYEHSDPKPTPKKGILMKTSRRSFLKSASAVSAAPFILPSSIWSAETKPNDRIVMGFIGMGKQNRGLLGNFLRHRVCRVVAVCEVDTTRRVDAQNRVNEYYKAKPELTVFPITGVLWCSLPLCP